MKKILAIILGLLLMTAPGAKAAGTFDGIWTITASGALLGFASIHENNGTLLIALLDNSLEWEAVYGPITGNQAQLQTIVISDVAVSFALTFTSQTRYTATLTACQPISPDSTCDPIGTTLTGERIF